MAASALAAAVSMPAMAGTQTWNFNSSTQSFVGGAANGNALNMTVDGIQLKITGWSDTEDTTPTDKIETAQLIWASTNGLGVRNRDEGTTSPDHSVDSSSSDSNGGEFDMLLLEFSTAINLTGLDLNWATGGNAVDRADMSLLAYVGGDATLGGKTWAGVLGASGTAYDSVGNPSNVGLSYFTVNPANITSTKWLVGVYNPTFGAGGDARDDGIKLASLTTSDTPPDRDVPVPGTLVLLLAGLAALRARRPLKGAKA